MVWTPPPLDNSLTLRRHLPDDGWRIAIEHIARRHGLVPCEFEPYAMGESIVWRAGEYVIKLTIPQCAYQIVAEVDCLEATRGTLSLVTPKLHSHGDLSGWPYMIMERIGGCPLSEVWPQLDHDNRRRLARNLGSFCRELHSLPTRGFPGEWAPFWRAMTTDVGKKHAGHGTLQTLVGCIDPFLAKVGELVDLDLVPLHTELIDQHIYVDECHGQFELFGVIDFADARLGAPHYEFGSLVEFVFKGERGLLHEFMLAYGVSEDRLTSRYSETLLAWSLCHRFSNLGRTLAILEPLVPSSLEEVATVLYSLSPF